MDISCEIEEILTSVDTPTISNALDIYRGDRSVDDFTKLPFTYWLLFLNMSTIVTAYWCLQTIFVTFFEQMFSVKYKTANA